MAEDWVCLQLGMHLQIGVLRYVGFELNQQKTEKPASLNICCSRASQLLTKNPPDRVVMVNTTLT